MDPMQNNEGRTPFEDLTNKIIGGGQTSNLQEQVDERAKRKREREKARHAAMTQEQKDERNKKQKEKYHQRKADTAAAGSRVGVEPTTKGSDDYEDNDWLHRNDSYEPMQIDEDNTRVLNTPGSINNIVTCPKERKRELDRARRAAMSPEQKALLNKRRRVLYAQKTATRKLQMTPQEREEKRKEMKRNYNKSVREHRASHLHPDSIAMESPHVNPQIIFPTPQLPKVTSQDMEIPELTGTPVHIAPVVVQTPEVQDHELTTHTIHRHRVTPGERNLLMSRRNETFEASIGRRARGCANGKCSEGNDPTQSSVVYNDGVTQESSVPPPNNYTGTQTQPAVVDGTSPMPTNGAQDDTPDSMVEDDYDADIIFEDDEEEEAYFFAGQDYDEDGTDVEHTDDSSEQENIEPDVPDPYDRLYANVPSESHMILSVPNCVHCDAKKIEGEPPGFCCRGGKIRLSTPKMPPELMRLWTSSDADARHFRANIRYFNGHFSFTSLYCHLDRVTTNLRICGVYTFRANGQIYHNIRSFGKEDGVEKRYLELYFYDDDPSLEHRMSKCRKQCAEKDKEVIEQLVRIFNGNPYSQQFRSVGHVENLEDYRIELDLD